MLAYLQTGLYKIWEFARPKKKLGWKSFVFLGIFVLAIFLVSAHVAHANPLEAVADILSSILLWVATLFLKIAIFLLTFIIELGGYNGYLDSTAVNYGWVVVRDVTNMLFVVILLLIAFGTILGIEQYEWKKMLVKMVMAAILVNMSRIICGLIIDVGQVVMITFINGIAATAAGNLINGFNAGDIATLVGGKKPPNSGEVFMASIAALVFSGIMMATMLVFIFILLARMITLWVLIVLSPLAFVLSVIPQTQKFAGEWWQNFGNNVVSGPVIAFFLWLSLVTVGGGNINNEIAASSQSPDSVKKQFITGGGANDLGDQEVSAGITSAMSWAKMANFAIAIGMLLVGARTAQSLGVAGGAAMSKATDFGKKLAMIGSGAAAAKWAAHGAEKTAKFIGMKIPVVGGDAWVNRGKRIRNWGYRTAEKWNTKVGSRLGAWAQIGAKEKWNKELDKQLEVFKGKLSSSAKGWQGLQISNKWRNRLHLRGDGWGKISGELPGQDMPFLERVRAQTDTLEGEQELLKEGSETMRTGRRNFAKSEKLKNDDAAAKKYTTRSQFAETQSNLYDGTKIGLTVKFVTSGQMTSLTDSVNAMHERETAASALQSAKKRRTDELETEASIADNAQLTALDNPDNLPPELRALAQERNVIVNAQKDLAQDITAGSKGVVEAQQQDTTKTGENEGNIARAKKLQDEANRSKEEAIKMRKESEDLQKKLNDPTASLTEEQKRAGSARVAELNAGAEAKEKDATAKEEEASKLIKEEQEYKPKVDSSAQKAKEQLEILQKIKEALEKQLKKQLNPEDMEKLATELNGNKTFQSMYGDKKFGQAFLEKQNSQYLAGLMKALEKNDGMTSKGTEMEKNSLALDKLNKAIAEPLKKMIKQIAQTNMHFAATYYKALSDNKAAIKDQAQGTFARHMAQTAVFNERGWTDMPKTVSASTIEHYTKQLAGVEREQLLQYFINQKNIMSRKESSKAGYKGSSEHLQDRMLSLALAAKMQATGYVDDATHSLTASLREHLSANLKQLERIEGLNLPKNNLQGLLDAGSNSVKVEAMRGIMDMLAKQIGASSRTDLVNRANSTAYVDTLKKALSDISGKGEFRDYLRKVGHTEDSILATLKELGSHKGAASIIG